MFFIPIASALPACRDGSSNVPFPIKTFLNREPWSVTDIL